MSDAIAKKPKKLKKVLLLVANFIVIAGLAFTSVFFFLKYQNLKNNNLTTEQRISRYEKEISKTYTLPVGDKPTLADVKNADDLKKDDANKEFFKDSQNGDILLVYPTTKLGILYRPSTKKIIKAGPVAFAQQVSTVLYGAKADRDTAAGILKKAFAATVSIAGQSDAKAAIASTVVVDVSGKNGELAGQLAAELKGKVGSVPEGQDIPPSGVGIAIFVAPTTTTGDGTSTAPTNP